jgi:isoamylase
LIERRVASDMAAEAGEESLIHLLGDSRKSWHGVKLNQPDWSHSSHSFALTAEILKNHVFVHWILNAWGEPLDFELPTEYGQWNRWIDTSLESPEDIVAWEEARPVVDRYYRAAPHSVVVLLSSTSPTNGSQPASH